LVDYRGAGKAREFLSKLLESAYPLRLRFV
jgi:hypothetical protein